MLTHVIVEKSRCVQPSAQVPTEKPAEHEEKAVPGRRQDEDAKERYQAVKVYFDVVLGLILNGHGVGEGSGRGLCGGRAAGEEGVSIVRQGDRLASKEGASIV